MSVEVCVCMLCACVRGDRVCACVCDTESVRVLSISVAFDE